MTARIGIDLGGTKIAGVVLAADGTELARQRVATPRNDYAATIAAIVDLVRRLRQTTDTAPRANGVGIGIPGSIAPRTRRVQNANSTWLNGRDLQTDLEAALGEPAVIANDANCFALSEAADGAAVGAGTVLGVILGTGVGSGIVINGRIVSGPLGIGGEFGHNPLPWPDPKRGEVPGPQCWCGQYGCIEAWVSGPGMAADHLRSTNTSMTAEAIAVAANRNDPAAQHTLQRHADRLARAIAHVMNIIDPNVVVLGGGLSQITTLYDVLPKRVEPHLFSDWPTINIVPPKWGDASGVRGAARLVQL